MIIIKAKLPHQFFVYASNFTLESMIKIISYWSYYIFLNSNTLQGKMGALIYNEIMIGNTTIKQNVTIVQTWLIDMQYDIIMNCSYGTKTISENESLHLISLYNDYCNQRKNNFKKSDIFMYLYGLFGEQKKFQSNTFRESFSREKYILESVSRKNHTKNTYDIDIANIFVETTNFSTDEHSSIILYIAICFIISKGIIFNTDINTKSNSHIFTNKNILNVLSKNSITVEKIRNSKLNRQIFYSKPIIKIQDSYIASNYFMILSLFENSNYWVIRNKFNSMKSQTFLNAFGSYFEIYVEEILSYCSNNNQFRHIDETNNGKRADWIINFGQYKFIVEQKSTLSLLGIKQNQPDIVSMKQYILKTWGEAVRQLSETQTALNIEKPIKIILLYEDYYKAECLDELFKLDCDLKNDNNYWLVTIREFEMLLITYKNSPDLFFKIINEKIDSEYTHSLGGRELEIFLRKNNIIENQYLIEAKIINEYYNIKNSVLT